LVNRFIYQLSAVHKPRTHVPLPRMPPKQQLTIECRFIASSAFRHSITSGCVLVAVVVALVCDVDS